MQVFKLYFKVLRKNLTIMFMYVGIFMALVIGVILPSGAGEENQSYTQMKSNFAVFDYDNSMLSQELTDYMQSIHDLQTIADDERETIQDELYADNVDCVIRIKEGYEEAFQSGKGDEYLEIYHIPDAIASILFEQNLSSYLSVVNTYLKVGFTMEEAVERSKAAAKESITVELTGKEQNSGLGTVSVYYNYLAWVFMAVCINSIAAVINVLDKKNVRNRIECSPYKFLRMNMEVILGVLVTGFTICAGFVALSIALFSQYLTVETSLLYGLNAFCIMSVTLAITFLVSKVTDQVMVISAISNIVGLGMAFLCGVFVSLELLGDMVINIAHFLPVYWYVRVSEMITAYNPQEVPTMYAYMGIQLLFAIAITCVGILVARNKRGSGA